MKNRSRLILKLLCILSFAFFVTFSASTVMAAKDGVKSKAVKADNENSWAGEVKASFDVNKMSDMSGYNPKNYVNPTGDTIRLAVVASYSGPGAVNGEWHYMAITWAAYDINKRGGIWVDGKRKLVEVLRADHMSKPDQCKKICERMVLQEKVHVLMGTNGSHLMKIINDVANKYKIIAWNFTALSDDLQSAANFGRYSFMGTPTTGQLSRSLAYYFGQISKKEKKFYIICQDYVLGHVFADTFKAGLKQYYPDAQLVGEDYHKLYLTDFAPYLEKIKASGAEVIVTGNWPPDSTNLLKQARAANINIPFAHWAFEADISGLQSIGIEGTKDLIKAEQFDVPSPFKNPGYVKYYKEWHKQWKKWPPPYNLATYAHPVSVPFGNFPMQAYWLLSAIERAKSTDAEKIIQILENDTYRAVNGKVLKMRACDHKTIQNMAVALSVPPAEQKISMSIPPYYWFNDVSWTGPVYVIPAAKVLPDMDQNLARCKGKNDWGE